jgi:hypothetical protein
LRASPCCGESPPNYIEIKKLIERRTLANKKGKLTDEEIKSLVKEWHDHRAEGELNQQTVESEIRSMEKSVAKYNVEQLGSTPIEREDWAMRILVCQMGGMVSPEARAIKIAATQRLIKKYNINVILFMEINLNWSKVNSSANLSSWFQEDREVRSVVSHNATEDHVAFEKHQPGGTGILVRHETRIPAICQETSRRRKRTGQVVLMAVLQQSKPHNKNSSRLQAMLNQGKRTKDCVPTTEKVHAEGKNPGHSYRNVQQRLIRPDQKLENDRRTSDTTNGRQRRPSEK